MEELYKLASSMDLNCRISNSVTIKNGERSEYHEIVLGDGKNEYKFDNVDDAKKFLLRNSEEDKYIDNVFYQIKNCNCSYQYVPVLRDNKSCDLLILTKDNRLVKEVHFDCIYCLEEFFNELDPKCSCNNEEEDEQYICEDQNQAQACLPEEDDNDEKYNIEFNSHKELDGIVTLFNSRYMDHDFGWRMQLIKNTVFLKSKIYGLHLQATANNYDTLVHIARMIYTDQLFKEYMKMCQSLVEEGLDAMLVIKDHKYCLEIISLDDNSTELKLENMTLKEFANTIYSIIKQS